MTSVRTLIVLKSSHHKNTARVAKSIAQLLQADVVAPEEVDATVLDDYDLVGFGSGIYFGMFHPALRRWVNQLETTASRRPAFLFSTAGLSFLNQIWHWWLKNKLSRKGFDVVGEFSCRGYDTVGPLWLVGGLNRGHPDDADLLQAANFARRLLDLLQHSGLGPLTDVARKTSGSG